MSDAKDFDLYIDDLVVVEEAESGEPSEPRLTDSLANALGPRTYLELADLRILQMQKIFPLLDETIAKRDREAPPAVQCAQVFERLTGESLDFCVNLFQGVFSVGQGQIQCWMQEFRREPWAREINWRLFGVIEAPPPTKVEAPAPELVPVFVVIEEGTGRVEVRLPPGYVALQSGCKARIAGEKHDTVFIEVQVVKE